MAKRAVVTGITGQDGSYLAEFLLEKGYEVIGVVRRSSLPNLGRIQHLLESRVVAAGGPAGSVVAASPDPGRQATRDL